MESEIETAEWPICYEEIKDVNNCVSCKNGHKFHNTCISQTQNKNVCPVCRNDKITKCKNTNNVFSGGKRRRTRKYKKVKKTKPSPKPAAKKAAPKKK